MSRRLVVALLVFVLARYVLPAFPTPVGAVASTYVVTTTQDNVESAVCPAENCTLRQAVNAANAHAPGTGNTNTITFVAGLAGTITLVSGELALSGDVAITGPGTATLVVSGNATSRVFSVGNGVTASISDLTVTQGMGDTNGGGGILNNGTLTLTRCTVRDNTTTGDGGGIAGNVGAALTLTDSAVSNNTAVGLNGGGGIYNNSGTVSITGSTIAMNTLTARGSARGIGGGMYQLHGTATIARSIVRDNTAGSSGGLSVQQGALTITDSVVSGNAATPDSYSTSSGGIGSFEGTLIIRGSTISNNRAEGGYGGGVYVDYGGTAEITNSSLIGNTAPHGYGGGLIINGGEKPAVTVTNTTITDNRAQDGSGIEFAVGTLSLRGTIVAGNNTTSTDISLRDTFYDGGYNFIGVGIPGDNQVMDGVNGDRVGTVTAPLDPHLAPLADNGGTAALPDGTHTPTRLPSTDSPVIDTGGVNCPPTDQRGDPRGGTAGPCDIGAVEVQPVALVVDPVSPVGTAGQSVRLTGAGFRSSTMLTVDGVAVALARVSADGTQLDVILPAHTAGFASDSVANPGAGMGVSTTITYTRPNATPMPHSAAFPTGVPVPIGPPHPTTAPPLAGTPTPNPAPARH